MSKFAEILSLEESEFDMLSHRRSKSSSHFNSPTNEGKNFKKYYLLEKKGESNINPSNNDTSRLIEEKYNLTHTHTDTFNTLNTFNLSIHSHSKKNNNLTPITNTNMTTTIDLSTKYKNLEEKYNKLKEKYHLMKSAEKNWRNSYFTLLKDSFPFEETIKNLLEENRIHQEYIINLENKLNKLFATCSNITNNFHNSMSKNLPMLQSLSAINSEISMENPVINFNSNSNTNANIYQSFMKNYSEVMSDYKKQLEILAEEKDSLSTNLSISRHQQLQCSLKLENLQTRVVNLEQARMEDLKVIEAIKN